MSHSPSSEIGEKGEDGTTVPKGPARALLRAALQHLQQQQEPNSDKGRIQGLITQPSKLVEMLKQLHKEDTVMYHFNYAYNGFIFLLPYFIIENLFSHIHFNSQIQFPAEQFINNLMHNKAPILPKAAILE